MKKFYIIFTISAVFVIVLASVSIFMAVNNSKGLSVSEAEEQYNSLFSNEEQMDDVQFTSSLCNLLAGIADGDRNQAEKYAPIIRKITFDSYIFEDEEVFSLAKELSDAYKALQSGEVTEGLQDITAASNNNGFTVYIEHIFCNRYKIENIENIEDEIIHYGEKSEKYDGSLGNNLIKITLYDTKLSDKWKSKYSMYEIYDLDNIYPDIEGGVKFMPTAPADHSVVIYIGSNADLKVAEQGGARVNNPRGHIAVEINYEAVSEQNE